MRKWLAWLGAVFASFLALELYSLKKGEPTLTASVRAWTVLLKWLPIAVALGVGVVFGHFWH